MPNNNWTLFFIINKGHLSQRKAHRVSSYVVVSNAFNSKHRTKLHPSFTHTLGICLTIFWHYSRLSWPSKVNICELLWWWFSRARFHSCHENQDHKCIEGWQCSCLGTSSWHHMASQTHSCDSLSFNNSKALSKKHHKRHKYYLLNIIITTTNNGIVMRLTYVWSILLLCRLVSFTDLSIEQLSIVASDARLWNAKSRIGFEWTNTNSDVLKSSVLIWNSIKLPAHYELSNLYCRLTVVLFWHIYFSIHLSVTVLADTI